MKIRICLLALALFLTSCSPNVQQAEESIDSDGEGIAVVETATATPTLDPAPTLEVTESVEDAEDPAQVELTGGIWTLTAEFQWKDGKTPTNILYTYEGFFILDETKRMQTMETLHGHASGDGGVNVNGECLETVPVEAEWTFVIQGKIIELDGVELFEFSLDEPDIKSVNVPPFETCMPDVDEEFRNNLLTFWITFIPQLPEDFRRIPTTGGVHCPGEYSFEDEGLGVLNVCYTVIEP